VRDKNSRIPPFLVRLLYTIGYQIPEDPVPVGEAERFCILAVVVLSAIYAGLSAYCLIGTTGISMWLAFLLNATCECQSVAVLLRQHEEYVSRKYFTRGIAVAQNGHGNLNDTDNSDLLNKTESLNDWKNYVNSVNMSPYKKRLGYIGFAVALLIVSEMLYAVEYFVRELDGGISLFVFSAVLLIFVMLDIWIDQAVAFYRAEA